MSPVRVSGGRCVSSRAWRQLERTLRHSVSLPAVPPGLERRVRRARSARVVLEVAGRLVSIRRVAEPGCPGVLGGAA